MNRVLYATNTDTKEEEQNYVIVGKCKFPYSPIGDNAEDPNEKGQSSKSKSLII